MSSSTSFEQLHPAIQRWIWQRGWSELREAQERAIPILIEGTQDVVIAASTASGKTEAAFLPIASRLLGPGSEGLAIYVSPLKALINDQWSRMTDLLGSCEVPVHPWHGDIASSKKTAFERQPTGVLLITPESLESIFVRKGFYTAGIFQGVCAVVVDELHSFINTERGMQLSSLLNRLEVAVGRRVQRVGLSATLGDIRLAAEYLRPGEGANAAIIESSSGGQGLKLLIKGYVDPRDDGRVGDDPDAEDAPGLACVQIARDAFQALRGSRNLIFVNSRRRVEEYTDLLTRICDAESVPVEFHAHHGSLSKSLREDVEDLLRASDRPGTAVCTSTLEMGIDIGQVSSVCQMDPPFSVASLRQRLGRSGRRGQPAILRMFIAEPESEPSLPLQDRLRLDLVQAVATTELLLAKWCEPPSRARLHLSTLIQQVLSLIAERGGVTAKEAWIVMCKTGPFRAIDSSSFMQLLRSMAAGDLIVQSADGTLLHGVRGEQIVNHYSFFTAFQASEDFQVVHATRVLGTLPVRQPLSVKSRILFGGKRWQVVEVDERRRVISVVPSPGGRAPMFSGAGGGVHARVHEEMYRLYTTTEVPAYLDAGGRELLAQGRDEFGAAGLKDAVAVDCDGACLLFLWAGDCVANTLLAFLVSLGYQATSFGVGVEIDKAEAAEVLRRLAGFAEAEPPDAAALAGTVRNRIVDKYDAFLAEELLNRNYASAAFDVEETWRVLLGITADRTS